MTRSFSASTVLPYTFAQTAQAMWFKYPNPFAEHVRSIDVLDHRVCPQTGVVYIERLIQLHQNIPGWIEKINEDIAYVPHHGGTRHIQDAHLEFLGLGHKQSKLLSSAVTKIEDLAIARFRENAKRGRAGFMHVLETLFGPRTDTHVEAET